jgi:hypothetical protein
MRISRPKPLGALILFAALVPPLAIQFEFGSAIGVIAVSIMSVVSALTKGRLLSGASTAVAQVVMWSCVVVAYLLFSGLFSLVTYPAFSFGRFFQSLILMGFLLFGAYCFNVFVNSCTEGQVDRAVRAVFMVILFSSVARLLGIHLSGGESSRTVFFYNEPSHYALGLAPFLLYIAVSDAKRRLLWLVSSVLIGLAVQSLTLIIVVSLIFAVVMRLSIVTLIFAFIITALALLVGDGLGYYTDRLMLSGESSNLSNLVYISGWERSWLSMNETLGRGYGFNQLGLVGDQGKVMSSLSALGVEGLNALDGGSVAPKLIAEFGAAGVLLLMIYAKVFFKGVRFLRSAMGKMPSVSRIELFFWSCLVTYSIDLFVRGAGYFTAESFMFLGAIWGLAARTGKRKEKIGSGGRLSPVPGSMNQIASS